MSVLENKNFTAIESGFSPRLVMSIQGPPKVGKTRFSFTAPGPIVYMVMDIGGEEGVVDSFLGTKQIYKKEYRLDPDQRDNANECKKRWDEFSKDYIDIVRSGEARTIVWDNATDLWELCRLAYFMPKFGRLEKVEAFHYGRPKLELKELIFLAQSTKTTSLILIHKERKNFTTGALELHGPGDVIEYAVPLHLRMDRNRATGAWTARCLLSRARPELEMNQPPWPLRDSFIDFSLVAAEVTQTPADLWE